jgi:methyl-accepting chemotaxis protein
MRREAQQAAKALVEQTRAIREVATAAADTTRNVKLLSRANLEHSAVADQLLGRMSEIRRITDRNASGAKDTLGSTDELLAQARTLTALMQPVTRRATGNGARRTNGSRSTR